MHGSEPAPHDADAIAQRLVYSQVAHAELLIRTFGHELRYVVADSRWAYPTPDGWRLDDRDHPRAIRAALAVACALPEETRAQRGFKRRCSSWYGARSALRIAQHDRRVRIDELA